MQITRTEFSKSAALPKDFPPSLLPEIAFCGRSNVGKSTLLNHLLHRKGIARVSRTPGRTRLLNFFEIRAQQSQPDLKATEAQVIHFGLVDLPGFGYAKVSKIERETWRPLIEAYFTKRSTLRGVILLFDSRRVASLTTQPNLLQEEEDLFLYLTALKKEVVPIITKADKLSRHERKPAVFQLQKRLHKKPLLFSAQTGEGIEQLSQHLEQILVSSL